MATKNNMKRETLQLTGSQIETGAPKQKQDIQEQALLMPDSRARLIDTNQSLNQHSARRGEGSYATTDSNPNLRAL